MDETQYMNMLVISLKMTTFTETTHKSYIKNMKVRPYYKSELTQAYAPGISPVDLDQD